MMNNWPAFVLGALWGLLKVAIFIAAYQVGTVNKQHEIVGSCNAYGKYALEGTWVLLCSTNNPEMLAPQIDFYSKENKDKNRHNRK